jgi:hypothetical protein
MKTQRNHNRQIVGLILAIVGLINVAAVVLSAARRASAQTVAPSWSYTGNLNFARAVHTATLLRNGKVLVAGGSNYNPGGGIVNSAELCDSSTGIWTSTGNLNTSRYAHIAILLPNGKVLVAGGYDGRPPNILNSAELYDPATGTWSITGNLNTPRAGWHTATLLPNGKVLVVGGIVDSDGHTTNSAELYDPSTGTWSYTGNLDPAAGGPAMLLPNGKVLVVGSDRVDLYDPATGTWSITVNPDPIAYHSTATLLPDGKVLLAGGMEIDCFGGCPSNTAELYDPATGTWTSTGNLNLAGGGHTAILLLSGKVLVIGYGNSAELYDPATGTWSIAAGLNTARVAYTTTLLSNGKVLVGGGNVSGGLGTLNSVELYDPGTNPTPNQIDEAQYFVRQQYLDFLNREPDAGGLAYWTDRITQCGSDARCIHERRIGVSAAFFIEQEFQDTGYYVDRFYKASFGRQPNYAEFTSDRSKFTGGSNLEANKQAFADEWVQRPAFVTAYPVTLSNTEVVNKLFDSAGLTGSTYDLQRQQEIAAMNAGRSRALVLRDVIEIPDFKNIPDPNDPRYSEIKQTSQYNPAFVLMQYFGYFKRNVDQGGYDFWLDVLNNREPNNYHGMVCSFLTSSEYQLRFGSSVTRSNADCSR